MTLSIILGTRPEIIKMSPVIRECQRLGLEHFILHTGQHYSYNMDRVFFEELKLPDANYNLEVGSGAQGEQTAKMMTGIEKVLMKEKPEAVLVQGDTNTVLAGALAAVKLGIKVGHVEAGLRSYDRSMPEEINRVMADHCSDQLFAPTEKCKNTLLGEGIPGSRIHVTGNTIVDAVYENLVLAKEKNTLEKLKILPDEYFLVTAHRQENVDDRGRFAGLLKGVEELGMEFNIPVIYPIPIRARKKWCRSSG
jgi:UDP-N-acetylglucosamine 2-epimerase (non-hydrolysing)